MPPAAQRPVAIDADVVVAGGGAAGVAAALSAARAGARVALIERMGFLGGSATAMQVPAFGPFSDRTRAVVRGIPWEIMTALQARRGRPLPDPDAYAVPQDDARMDWVPVDPEILKRLCDDLCEEAGVVVRFHTFVPDVLRDGDRIDALVLAGKDGLALARARVFVDATGDADVAARAGCPFQMGDDGGRTQGMTLCFTIAGGSRAAYLEYVHRTGDGYLARCVAAARDAGEWDLPDSSLVGLSFKDEQIAGCNLGHVYGHDPTDPDALSRAEREGRRVAEKIVPFLRRYVPGQQDARLVSTGPHIGVRESRRIVGDHVLTLDDYLSCRSFPDDVARGAYFIDLHAATTDAAARAVSISDGERRAYALPPGRSHGIPYRCLLPQGVENLLVAGRCLSATRDVQGAARIMPVCAAMGEAAGLAAAMAAAAGARVRDVEIQTLQARLRAQGAWLGDPGERP